MSVGPLGIIGGTAAAGQTQRSAAADRAATDNSRHQAEAANDAAAEAAAGIGQADGEQHETHERDAHGGAYYQQQQPEDERHILDPSTGQVITKSLDTTGDCGGGVDLEG